ncbi:hypothetical protein [Promicromonospora sp. NPDC050262]|uniref:hypothetical protein n=1 Tax=Promicromonospora sp. NPDC050262 TaxID=3155036 RepID=UPI0033D93557
MVEQWDIALGTITTRAEVAERFGGSTRNGISSSASTPNVMIYSDPEVGRRHGYNFDGWADDGAFYYTGDGQLGDQNFVSGNKAIMNHTARGMTLRVFEAVPGVSQKGGKPQRYLGSFRVDPGAPWRREEARDRKGELRTVLVFRLLPIDAETPTDVEILSGTPATAPAQEFLPPENNVVKELDVAARKGSTAQRREAELMNEFEDFLLAREHKVGRLQLAVPGVERAAADGHVRLIQRCALRGQGQQHPQRGAARDRAALGLPALHRRRCPLHGRAAGSPRSGPRRARAQRRLRARHMGERELRSRYGYGHS